MQQEEPIILEFPKPVCKLVAESRRYRQKVIRSIHFEQHTLSITFQGPDWLFGKIIFKDVFGFRVLDERDLVEFWNTYSEPKGWLWEVESGGWHELERKRQSFNVGEFITGLREYLIVDDQCVSVLTRTPPEIIDCGGEPPPVLD